MYCWFVHRNITKIVDSWNCCKWIKYYVNRYYYCEHLWPESRAGKFYKMIKYSVVRWWNKYAFCYIFVDSLRRKMMKYLDNRCSINMQKQHKYFNICWCQFMVNSIKYDKNRCVPYWSSWKQSIITNICTFVNWIFWW